MEPSKSRIPNHLLFRVAVGALVDPRTVRRVLRGEPTRAATRERIEDALRGAGLADLIPGSAVRFPAAPLIPRVDEGTATTGNPGLIGRSR